MEDSAEVLSKLEILIRLQLLALVEGRSQREQIRLLSLAGLAPKAISELLGTSANNVNVQLTTLRKAGRLRISGGKSE